MDNSMTDLASNLVTNQDFEKLRQHCNDQQEHMSEMIEKLQSSISAIDQHLAGEIEMTVEEYQTVLADMDEAGAKTDLS